MKNIGTRLAKIEEAAAQCIEAEHRRALQDFNMWCEANWSEAEQALWTRHLLTLPMTDSLYDHLSMSRAEAEAIMAEYAPLTPEESLVLEASWARVPAEILERLNAR